MDAIDLLLIGLGFAVVGPYLVGLL